MSCEDCAGCDPDLMPQDPFPPARPPASHAVPCRSCAHPVGAHTFAAVRVRLPGVQVSSTATPGSPLDRLQKLVAAQDQGLLTADEVKAAVHRMMRTDADPDP